MTGWARGITWRLVWSDLTGFAVRVSLFVRLLGTVVIVNEGELMGSTRLFCFVLCFSFRMSGERLCAVLTILFLRLLFIHQEWEWVIRRLRTVRRGKLVDAWDWGNTNESIGDIVFVP